MARASDQPAQNFRLRRLLAIVILSASILGVAPALAVDPLTVAVLILRFLETPQGQQVVGALTGPPSQAQQPRGPEGPPGAAEIAENVLHCFHPTGQYITTRVVEQPWRDQASWSGDASALMEITWRGGFTGRPYISYVALVRRQDMVRGVVVAE